MVRFKEFIARLKTQVRSRKGPHKKGRGIFVLEFWDSHGDKGWHFPVEILNFDDHKNESALWYFRSESDTLLPFRYLDSWLLVEILEPKGAGGKAILRIKRE